MQVFSHYVVLIMTIHHVTVNNVVFVKCLHVCVSKCTFARACNVGANSLNVVSRTFPHFSQSMLIPMEEEEQEEEYDKIYRPSKIAVRTKRYNMANVQDRNRRRCGKEITYKNTRRRDVDAYITQTGPRGYVVLSHVPGCLRDRRSTE